LTNASTTLAKTTHYAKTRQDPSSVNVRKKRKASKANFAMMTKMSARKIQKFAAIMAFVIILGEVTDATVSQVTAVNFVTA